MIWDTDSSPDLRWIAADAMRGYRRQAGWTQQQLAEAMKGMGFPWQRNTVADTERLVHPLTVAELVALSALFAVPVVTFLLPEHRDPISLAEAGIAADDLRELVLGRGGSAGEGGADWGVARRVAGVERDDDPWPARDLWK